MTSVEPSTDKTTSSDPWCETIAGGFTGTFQLSLLDLPPLEGGMESRITGFSRQESDGTGAHIDFQVFLEAKASDGSDPKQTILKCLLPHSDPCTIDYATLLDRAVSPFYLTPHGNGGGSSISEGARGQRVSYQMADDSLPVQALAELEQASVFNAGFAPALTGQQTNRKNISTVGPTDHSINLNLNWPELRDIRENSIALLKQQGVSVLLPCHAEPGSAYLNLFYAARTLGASNVFCVNTNITGSSGNRETQESLRAVLARTDCRDASFALQDMILSYVDWRKIGELTGVKFPVNEFGKVMPPLGAKGLTLYAGIIMLEAKKRLSIGSHIILHDTDIINPFEYDAIPYLGLPQLYKKLPGRVGWNAVYIGRTGIGRNNEPIHATLSQIASNNDPHEDANLARKLAINAILAPWPLTGERMISSDVVRRITWTNDMTIESHINISLAEEALNNGQLSVAHVMNPSPKIENGSVPSEREWRMMTYCAYHHHSLISASIQERVSLLNCDLGGIAALNPHFAGRGSLGMITNKERHAGNIAFGSIQPVVLPSIEMLVANNLVDWSALRELIG
jgi:hypothetical protein